MNRHLTQAGIARIRTLGVRLGARHSAASMFLIFLKYSLISMDYSPRRECTRRIARSFFHTAKPGRIPPSEPGIFILIRALKGAYTVLQMAALAALLGGSLMPDSRILVVEDEPTSREIVDFVLSGAGYGVDMAATAAAALMLLSSTRYGLVVADWMLPDGDGIYIADRALALGSYTLIVTGHLADLPPRTGERHRLLSKPVKPAELIAVVRDMIGEPPIC
jgi:CheY-like chemotaxis protein